MEFSNPLLSHFQFRHWWVIKISSLMFPHFTPIISIGKTILGNITINYSEVISFFGKHFSTFHFR